MDKKQTKKENRSMYIYTALIFAVALLLIIVAFFSQTNVSRLGKRADEFATEPPVASQTSEPKQDKLAKMANMAAELDTENKELKSQLTVYEKLLAANAHLSKENITDAQTVFAEIDEIQLSDDQRILYEEIKNKLNEGKEQ
mgnify:CR=1 FL=1